MPSSQDLPLPPEAFDVTVSFLWEILPCASSSLFPHRNTPSFYSTYLTPTYDFNHDYLNKTSLLCGSNKAFHKTTNPFSTAVISAALLIGLFVYGQWINIYSTTSCKFHASRVHICSFFLFLFRLSFRLSLADCFIPCTQQSAFIVHKFYNIPGRE